MLVLLSSFLALAVTSVLATWALGIGGLGPSFIATIALAAAVLVGLTFFLSLFSAYAVPGILIGQLVVLALVVACWLARGKPRPEASLPTRSELWAWARANRTVSVLVATAALAALIELVLALAVAPNTWDSQMYHLSRVALWIQDGSVFHFDGGTTYEREYAPNGEITYGWTVLLSDGDRFAAMVPWIFSLGCGALVYEGARLLRFERPAALFAASIFLLLPQVIVQASSTLIDLQAAFLIGAVALFGVRAFKDHSPGDLVVASLAAGLAVGTKGTALLAIPALSAFAAAIVIGWKPRGRELLAAGISFAVCLILLGSPQYVINAVRSGKPQGDGSADARRTSPLPTAAVRTAATFIDLPGMAGTMPAQLTQEVHDRVWPSGADPFNDTAVSEDGIGFGPLVPLLLFPLLAYYMFNRSEPIPRRLVAFAAASSIAAYALLFEPAFHSAHVLVLGVLLGAPLFAGAWSLAWVRHVSAATAVFFALIVLTQNQLKPLYPDPVFGLSRYQQQSLQHDFAPALERIDELIPADARIAYIGPRYGTWDLPFFGPHLDRYVFRLERDATPTDQEVRELVTEHDLDAVVFAGVDAPGGMKTTEIGEIAFSDHRVWFSESP